MPAGNRRPLYAADELPAVSEQLAQLNLTVPGPQTAATEHTAADTAFKQPCTFKGLSAALYAGTLGYFLGFVPAAIKFKARQWGMIHNQGMASASQLALMSGMYTTVHCICQRIRMVEDGWNRGIAGCSTGLVLGWKTGPWGALQSCASLGLLSALIDLGGGAVEAAEAAVLSQLQDLQQQQQRLQEQAAVCLHKPRIGQLGDSQQAQLFEQVLDIVACPCAAVGCMAQHLHRLRNRQNAATPRPAHKVPHILVPQTAAQSATAAAWSVSVQQVQQFLAAPPLMFLGVCCQDNSSSSSSGTAGYQAAVDDLGMQSVDGCALQQKRVCGPSKVQSKR